MEKNINKRIDSYITQFKNDMWQKISGLGFSEKDKVNDLLEYMYEYDRLSLTKEDFSKRKRVKNCIPELNRCNALRANGEQCTRQRKDNCNYCGTHSKGVVPSATSENVKMDHQKKVEVFAEDICGIVYYIDNANNVYKTEDVLEEKPNPAIIATYVKTESGYSIPEFGI
jgi:hypothetical protein